MMFCIVLFTFFIAPVNSQFNRDSWIDLKKATPTTISLDEKKVLTFKARPFGRRQCQRDSVLRCGIKCSCINNRRYCCRQRKDWDSLTHLEKTRFLDALFDIAMGRRGWGLRNRYVRLLYIHERFWLTAIHRREEFFPWHRVYMLKFENLLRSVDCRITVPYWDWTKQPVRWWQSSIFNRRYYGSNLDRVGRLSREAQCPSNGYFSPRNRFTDLRNRCLVRQFSYNVAPASYERIQRILSWTSFRQFESALRHEHGVPHFMVGGESSGLFFTERAAEDTLFWVHHSNVDYQWYQRQTRYPETWDEFWGQPGLKNRRLSAFGEIMGQAINPFKHGRGGVCVEYVENDDRYESMLERLRNSQFGNLNSGPGFALSKVECLDRSHQFPAQIFTLFRTTASEKKDFLNRRNQDGDC